ncbi:Zinc finger RING-type [Carpediemonas membranifera]|uniref:Zinc finger RING-type n=1 Tax=Carpediemonas membranifera TaxID=201153 RepID=A0A8J6E3B2_9EUKA|nr:Zinc finger RING-type [Carpediemonas membranifera]|eukprot:KAG9392917.1 Zinc finger RING-type [Carpediemonas membranifera]
MEDSCSPSGTALFSVKDRMALFEQYAAILNPQAPVQEPLGVIYSSGLAPRSRRPLGAFLAKAAEDKADAEEVMSRSTSAMDDYAPAKKVEPKKETKAARDSKRNRPKTGPAGRTKRTDGPGIVAPSTCFNESAAGRPMRVQTAGAARTRQQITVNLTPKGKKRLPSADMTRTIVAPPPEYADLQDLFSIRGDLRTRSSGRPAANTPVPEPEDAALFDDAAVVPKPVRVPPRQESPIPTQQEPVAVIRAPPAEPPARPKTSAAPVPRVPIQEVEDYDADAMPSPLILPSARSRSSRRPGRPKTALTATGVQTEGGGLMSTEAHERLLEERTRKLTAMFQDKLKKQHSLLQASVRKSAADANQHAKEMEAQTEAKVDEYTEKVLSLAEENAELKRKQGEMEELLRAVQESAAEEAEARQQARQESGRGVNVPALVAKFLPPDRLRTLAELNIATLAKLADVGQRTGKELTGVLDSRAVDLVCLSCLEPFSSTSGVMVLVPCGHGMCAACCAKHPNGFPPFCHICGHPVARVARNLVVESVAARQEFASQVGDRLMTVLELLREVSEHVSDNTRDILDICTMGADLVNPRSKTPKKGRVVKKHVGEKKKAVAQQKKTKTERARKKVCDTPIEMLKL